MNNVTLVFFRQTRWDGQQNASLKQTISNGARSLFIIRLGTTVLNEAPWEPFSIDTRFVHETDDIGLDVQAPVGHHDVVDTLWGCGNSFSSQFLTNPLRFLRIVQANDQEGTGVTVGVVNPPQPDLRESFEGTANAIFALPHVSDNRWQFFQLDAKNSATHLVEPASAAPKAEVQVVINRAAIVVSGVTVVVRRDRTLIQAGIVCHHAAAFAAAQVLVHLKAEDTHVPEAADLLAPDASSCALRAIFQKKQSAFARDLE
jgi:hypothetical protein